jgi:hypothetical protein
MPVTEAVYCLAEGCSELATEYAYDTATHKVDWAVCAVHKRWVRPYVSEGESRSSVSAMLLHTQLKATISFRLGLAGKKLPALVISELAHDIMADVFGSRAMRILAADVIERHNVGANV